MNDVLHQYGYAAIFVGIMLESVGVPLPGESMMIAAAIYAAATHCISILILVLVGAAAAICGDQIGYLVGRGLGAPALKRWGNDVGLTDERLELGRFLFRTYGGRIVFFGRFIALLRLFAPLLAGANAMPWHVFLAWNGLGGLCWASLYGFVTYLLGDTARRVGGVAGVAIAVIGGIVLLTAIILVGRNERKLMARVQRNMAMIDLKDPQTK